MIERLCTAFPIAGIFARLNSKEGHRGLRGRLIRTSWLSRLTVPCLPWYLTGYSESIGFQTVTPGKRLTGSYGACYWFGPPELVGFL